MEEIVESHRHGLLQELVQEIHNSDSHRIVRLDEVGTLLHKGADLPQNIVLQMQVTPQCLSAGEEVATYGVHLVVELLDSAKFGCVFLTVGLPIAAPIAYIVIHCSRVRVVVAIAGAGGGHLLSVQPKWVG